MKFRAVILILVIGLVGCRNQPVNPPRLVMDSETDASIQLFIQASIMMLQSYGIATIPYEDIQFRSQQAGFKTIPFMVPEGVRAAPRLIASLGTPMTPADYLATTQSLGTKPFVKYYIRTGLRAAQLICRNHLMRLDEGNQYFEFLKQEIGVASTFASGILALVNANGTLTKSFLIAVTGVNSGLNAYEDYQFLSIDRDAARVLVDTAQNKYAEYFLNQVDAASIENNVAVGGYTYSDALNAVSLIEYQCTREGIRYLLNRSINNTPSNMEIDATTGSVMFKSAKQNIEGTGRASATLITSSKMRLATIEPKQPDPGALSDTRLSRFEKTMSTSDIMRIQRFCRVPETGKLGGQDSPVRKALSKFLNGRFVIDFTTNSRIQDAIVANDKGCSPA